MAIKILVPFGVSFRIAETSLLANFRASSKLEFAWVNIVSGGYLNEYRASNLIVPSRIFSVTRPNTSSHERSVRSTLLFWQSWHNGEKL